MILIAPDSFKGSLSAVDAASWMERGVRAVTGLASSTCTAIPLADGGEGTLDAVQIAVGGTRHTVQVRGPLGDPVMAQWLELDSRTALIEMAQASGLPLVPTPQRDALRATSFGLGQLMRAALDANCRRLIIGLGGSATTDGASGALVALGARLIDACGGSLQVLGEVLGGGAALGNLHAIDLSRLDSRLLECEVEVLCDVSNPLLGARGAARVFAPQKGASPDDVQVLEAALARFADVTSEVLASDKRDAHGAGAAGGAGFGLLSFCNAKMSPGIERILDLARFDEKLKSAKLVLTGEGSLDEQTLEGKTIAGVCRRSQVLGVPVVAFGGAVKLSGAQMDHLGLRSAFSLADGPRSLSECVDEAGPLLAGAVERALRLMKW
jgi:glycerate kinase